MEQCTLHAVWPVRRTRFRDGAVALLVQRGMARLNKQVEVRNNLSEQRRDTTRAHTDSTRTHSDTRSECCNYRTCGASLDLRDPSSMDANDAVDACCRPKLSRMARAKWLYTVGTRQYMSMHACIAQCTPSCSVLDMPARLTTLQPATHKHALVSTARGTVTSDAFEQGDRRRTSAARDRYKNDHT
jgi:hypothetical protein